MMRPWPASLESLLSKLSPCGPSQAGRAVALGFFDGVHRGHQALLEAVDQVAEREGLLPTVLSFQDPPAMVLAPSRFPGLLMERHERIAALEAGKRQVLALPVEDWALSMAAEDFLHRLLFERLQVKAVVLGADFRFGHGAAGDVTYLVEEAAKAKVQVQVVQDVTVQGQKVSSTAIRQHLMEGRPVLVKALLGRAHAISSEVRAGKGLGRRLGFPTCNQALPSGLVVPRYGVYMTAVYRGTQRYQALSNFGCRPSVESTTIPRFESHLLDYDGQLYGERLRIELLAFWREERTFKLLADLQAQVQEDLVAARAWHAREARG